MTISIIICTKNRSADLEQTLRSLATVDVNLPDIAEVELVVVDNNSSDNTCEVVNAARIPGLTIRYVREERLAKSKALNTGIRSSKGDILVFSDDDVRFTSSWLRRLIHLILSGEADIVAGGVRLAPHLIRPSMSAHHLGMLADTSVSEVVMLAVGANMAFSRAVLSRVPSFDIELGPGALGFCEDLLFSFQLKHAGFRLGVAFDDEATVIHHPAISRLSRSEFTQRVEKEGRCLAYIDHHWDHLPSKNPLKSAIKRRLRLLSLKVLGKDRGELPPSLVMHVLKDIAYYDYLYSLRNTPRNYEKQGLVKRAGLLDN